MDGGKSKVNLPLKHHPQKKLWKIRVWENYKKRIQHLKQKQNKKINSVK